MIAAFFIVLIGGIAVLYWIILRNSSQKIHHQYQQFSEKLELELNAPSPGMGGFIRPEPSVYGDYQGRELSISVPGKGLQNTRQIETVLKLELNDKALAAQLTGTGLLGGFRQRDSGRMARWKSGDEAFDAAVDVRTNRADLFTHTIGADLRKPLMDLLKAGKGSIYIGGGVIAYAELGLIANDMVRERFESVLILLLSLAQAIEAS
ncbi:MAG: hypothetical protein AAF065_07740 [Verrucomicrobiota bacterium]